MKSNEEKAIFRTPDMSKLSDVHGAGSMILYFTDLPHYDTGRSFFIPEKKKKGIIKKKYCGEF